MFELQCGPGIPLALSTGMKTPSPWMPEAADESTMLDLIRKLLDLSIPIVRRPGGGFRIHVDAAGVPVIRTPDAKLIPAAV